MNRYLIAIDLDDTLLNDQSIITKKTEDYLKSLISQNHIIVLATGRPFRGMISYYHQLGLKTPLIADNGALIMNPSDSSFPIINQTIKIETVKEIFYKTKSYITSALYSLGENSYVYNRTKRLDFLLHLTKNAKLIEGPLDEICDLPPHGILFIVQTKNASNFENIILEYPHLKTRCWGADLKNTIYEVYIKNVNKSIGIKHIMKYYNIPLENLIAFGDGINDFEMLSIAYYDVAMKNGHELLIKQASYVTEYTNNEDGVVEHLKHFMHNQMPHLK